MDALSLILYIALGFAALYFLLILFKIIESTCKAPRTQEENARRLRTEFGDFKSGGSRRNIVCEIKEESKVPLQQKPKEPEPWGTNVRSNPSFNNLTLENEKNNPPTTNSRARKLNPFQSSRSVRNETSCSSNPIELMPLNKSYAPRPSPSRPHFTQSSTRSVTPWRSQGSRMGQLEQIPAGIYSVDSGRESLYPTDSLQTLDEFENGGSSSNRYKYSSLLQTQVDSSLVIGTASDDEKIVGYCVNFVKRKCSFYSYDIEQIPWDKFLEEQLGSYPQLPHEDAPVKNLFFATLLWYESILKYSSFRLHSNHPMVNRNNKSLWMKLLRHCLTHLQEGRNDQHAIMVNPSFYGEQLEGESPSSNVKQYSSLYELPSKFLLIGDFYQFQALMKQEFSIDRFEGTHSLQVADGEEGHRSTNSYDSYLQQVGTSFKEHNSTCSDECIMINTLSRDT